MMRSSRLTRQFATARRVFRESGVSGIVALARQRAVLRLDLLSAKGIESIALDGCTFGLKSIPETPMKLALVKGEYEDFERRAVLQYVDPEHPVIELGGCIGVVACITNRRVKRPRLHVVVEANPEVIPQLEENRRRNRCEFEILNAAIAYGPSSVTFSPARDWWGNSLQQEDAGSTVTVRTTSLREIVNERKFDAFTLICDIEGHEYDLLMNDADVLRKVDTLILETHARMIGEAKTNRLLSQLEELGLRMVDRESFVVVMKRS